MILPLDVEQIEAAGLLYEEADDVAALGLPTKDPEVRDWVKVRLIGGDLHFFEARSSAHKRVLTALGVNV